MFKCNDCNYVFEEPQKIRESRGEYWGAPCWETWYVCPNCKSNDYDEVKEQEDE